MYKATFHSIARNVINLRLLNVCDKLAEVNVMTFVAEKKYESLPLSNGITLSRG